MKDGLKKSSLVAKGKLLTIKNRLLFKMPDILTLTKFRTQGAGAASDGDGVKDLNRWQDR
jgi:hypothetical protein